MTERAVAAQAGASPFWNDLNLKENFHPFLDDAPDAVIIVPVLMVASSDKPSRQAHERLQPAGAVALRTRPLESGSTPPPH